MSLINNGPTREPAQRSRVRTDIRRAIRGRTARWTEGLSIMDTYQELSDTAADRTLAPTERTVAETEPSGEPMPDTTDREDAIPVIGPHVSTPSGWSDSQTGTDGPRYWDRLILSEAARVSRYKRPATVVLVEIAGLAALGRLWGPRVVEHTLAAAARILSKEIRTSDHIARIEPLRFGVLLTETTEIAAINFVERARAACDRDLQVASEVVGVAFGWASPPHGGDLSDAMALATKRLEAELAER
jgi:diguanylate cyclase (GGDEF)-like protein